MEILEYLDSIQKKVEELKEIEPLVMKETEQDTALKEKIEKEFQDKLAIEETKYRKIVAALREERNKKMQEELSDKHFYEQKCNIKNEKFSLEKALLKEHNINHALMCKLLKTRTGKQWKPVEVTGSYYWSHPIGPGRYYAYGVILFSEEHEFFSQEKLYYKEEMEEKFDKDNKNLLICSLGGSSSHESALERQKSALEHNWLEEYLLSKFGELSQTKRELIVGAIEPYIKNFTAFKANTSGNTQIYTTNTPQPKNSKPNSQSNSEDEQ